jgi:hypothetical protein
MADYSKLIIYKIYHNTKPDLIYVGSTTNYAHRKHEHKSRCQNPNDKEHDIYKYKMIRDNGGWNEFTMCPIKEFPCKTRIEALIEEDKCRLELKATLNSNACVAKPLEQKRSENMELIKKYKNDKLFLSIKAKRYTEADLE